MQNKGQFPKGTSGNPAGRPPGSRNRATVAIEVKPRGLSPSGDSGRGFRLLKVPTAFWTLR